MTQTKQPKTGSKFTAGPWKAVNTPITWQIRDAADEVITESWDYHPLPDANAHLIAQAPEMYELLEQLIDAGENISLNIKTQEICVAEQDWSDLVREARRIIGEISGCDDLHHEAGEGKQ